MAYCMLTVFEMSFGVKVTLEMAKRKDIPFGFFYCLSYTVLVTLTLLKILSPSD